MSLLIGVRSSLLGRHLSSQARVFPYGGIVVRPLTRGSSSISFALPEQSSVTSVDIRKLSDVITSQALEGEEQRHALEAIAAALGEPLAVVKNMAFRQKALMTVDVAEVKNRVEQVAEVVGVPYEKARQMCVIQPNLLTDTKTQAEALSYGLKIICHDLKAPKDEIVDLIISNTSLLHGRQMRLSAADMAHLALLREPKGRIVD